MWKLSEIYAQNICAFRELQYTPKQGVTTLIFGDNQDNESQRSNGSGKSALIECIAMGITGSPLRKIKNEEIINDNSEEAMIELTFINDSIRETFIVERKLYRKGSSQITCNIFQGDSSVAEKVVQPSVDEYNRFILDKLGISKEEVYNNFILSKYKYENFLALSDKDKKEFINRFSNGNMVDEAMEHILQDKEPLEKIFNRAELEVAGIDGRIELLKEQIEKEENSQEDHARTKEDKVQELEQSISSKRAQIRELTEEFTSLEIHSENIQHVDQKLQSLENSEDTLENYLSGIHSLLTLINKSSITDWSSVINGKKTTIKEAETELKKWDQLFEQARKKAQTMTTEYDALCREHKEFLKNSADETTSIDTNLAGLEKKLKVVQEEIETLKRTRRTLSAAIEMLGNKLAGIITCPSCGYEFIVSDKEFDVDAGREEKIEKEEAYASCSSHIQDSEKEMEEIESHRSKYKEDKQKIASDRNEWTHKIQKAESDLRGFEYEMETVKRNQSKIAGDITQLNNDLDGILRKAFDEAFEIVDDAYKALDRKKNSLNEEIKSAESSIETIEETIQQVKEQSSTALLGSLKKTLKEYRSQSMDAMHKKKRIEGELQLLSTQHQNFVEFKTYLANTKIEALASITNEFLENIGSDIRIRLSGFTVLKSGKVREKISVSLVRAGLNCGSFGKFSAGEAARVNLATILAMQKMINSGCDTDKGLNLLVLDEILSEVDEAGLASMFAAMNSLGLTTLVVSHGNIAEAYPHTLKIIKENGESRIETES